MPTIRTIPATRNRFSQESLQAVTKRKVAGYARVSTDHEDQQTSYEAQISYYTSYIQSRADWEFVEVYTDEGISATSTSKREGFKRMVVDALAGKIDLIVTKSVSRFARNTVDSLSTIRKLKEHGTEVYFEKENIWTFDSKGELLITIMSSLAQEESRSISENCTWGQRKRFADGNFSIPYSSVCGFEKGEDGKIAVNHEEAQIVQEIFGLFLQGFSPKKIAELLTEQGIPSPRSKGKWNQTTVKRMLQNEKYKGDALLQKVYTTDFLTKKLKKNEGEVPQYYVENSHEAIIDPEQFEMVQQLLESRVGTNGVYSNHPFSGRIVCGDCGHTYGCKTWHSNNPKYKKKVWVCNHKYKGDYKCQTPKLEEAEIEAAFISAINKLIKRRPELTEIQNQALEKVLSTAELEIQQNSLGQRLIEISDQVDGYIQRNARMAIDQEEYQRNYQQMEAHYNEIKQEYDRVSAEIADKKARRVKIKIFLSNLHKQEEPIDCFSQGLWYSLVDHVEVDQTKTFKFVFQDGTVI